MTYDFSDIEPLWNQIRNGIYYKFTWETMHDAHVCKVCESLDGLTWRSLELTPILSHPTFGDVYDLEFDRSLTHAKYGTCRCFLHVAVEVELSEIPEIANLTKEFAGVMHVMPSDVKQAITDVRDLEKQILMLDFTARQLTRMMWRLIGLLERAGLDENVERKLQEAQKMVMVMQQLLMSLAFIQMGTPYGTIMGILGLGVAASHGLEGQAR